MRRVAVKIRLRHRLLIRNQLQRHGRMQIKHLAQGTAFTFGGSISAESSYDIKYTISDAFTTVTVNDTISTVSVLMDFKAGGKGIAIGKVSEFDNTLEVSDKWNFRVYGKLLKAYIVDSIYPVGSIYMSVNATSPATLFGGTWTQLKDRFLLGAGSTYGNGTTGGEASHKLSVNEMPSHAHDTPFFNNMTNNGEMVSDFEGVFGKGMTASAAKSLTGKSVIEMWWKEQTNNAEGNEYSYLTASKGGSVST